jgi:rRNA maturation RNase YbeY
LDLRQFKKESQALLAAIGRPKATLSILLTDDRRMAELHKRWMGEPDPTDVLSFPMGGPLLGDIAISVETAARRCPRDVHREVTRCLVHGLLHLVGHDHLRKGDRVRMNRQERRLLRNVR